MKHEDGYKMERREKPMKRVSLLLYVRPIGRAYAEYDPFMLTVQAPDNADPVVVATAYAHELGYEAGKAQIIHERSA